MFLATSVFVIVWGILCITDRDLIWSMYQLDARTFGNRELRKGRNWQTNMRYQGIALVLLGLIGVMTSFGYVV